MKVWVKKDVIGQYHLMFELSGHKKLTEREKQIAPDRIMKQRQGLKEFGDLPVDVPTLFELTARKVA